MQGTDVVLINKLTSHSTVDKGFCFNIFLTCFYGDGMVKEFLLIDQLNTVRMFVKDASVDLDLQIKNPVLVPLHKTLPDPPYPQCL